MSNGYGQFCPIAKASEIFATRWTPLVLRELMAGASTFGDIQNGIPLMSRALLAERLRQMVSDGLIEQQSAVGRRGHLYCLTSAGEAFRPIVAALGQWGMRHALHRVTKEDLDPASLLWALRLRADAAALPDRRVSLKFEFSGVPASRTKFRLMWLVLDRSGIDVCSKDPGYPTDLLIRSPIDIFVGIYLGELSWRQGLTKGLGLEGPSKLTKLLPRWLRLDRVLGQDLPFLHCNVSLLASA